MSKRIVVACYEVPGYGGASTATYQLFKRLRRDNIDATFLNLIDAADVEFFRYVCGEDFGNPENLPDVHNLILSEPLFGPQPKLANYLEALSPCLMIGVDSIASLLLKNAAPLRKLVFFTVGCRSLQDLIFREGHDFLTQQKLLDKRQDPQLNLREREAVRVADLIIPHSTFTYDLYQHFYPSHRGKILSDVIWKAEWIYEEAQRYAGLAKPFYERDIDVLFVASAWARPEKNYPMVEAIARRLGSGVHVMGEVEKQVPGVTRHRLTVNRQMVFELMGRAKTVVCPSIFDAAPGILFEASAMNCNLVTSKNCGNWQLCHEDLLVDPFDLAPFVKAVELSLTRKFEDHMDFYLKAGAYQNLLDTLAVI